MLHTILLSLAVSLTATAAAALIGLPLGALLAVRDFRARNAVILAANALLGLPPVVVGLALYLLLSRQGPFGVLGLLFTPVAMTLAQFLLALPIVAALTHRAMTSLWDRYKIELRISGASLARCIAILLRIGRREAITAVLAGFGRTVSEVGAILIVGGNIAGVTRTMTTAITLETSEGNFGRALAYGFIVIGISLAVSATAFAFSRGPKFWSHV